MYIYAYIYININTYAPMNDCTYHSRPRHDDHDLKVLFVESRILCLLNNTYVLSAFRFHQQKLIDIRRRRCRLVERIKNVSSGRRPVMIFDVPT